MRRHNCQRVCAVLVGLMTNVCLLADDSFVNFESPQSHGLARGVDGERLFAVNTPARTLVVLSITEPMSPTVVAEIPVGLEPVSVAARSVDEAWVVNHVSNSVSVVDVARGVVIETIQVGGRPGDIVFADSNRLAFVSSMADRRVEVIDAATRRVITRIEIPADSPRTLLASRDGKTIWVASFRSGNGTTVIPHSVAPEPPPVTRSDLPEPPPQGVIVAANDPRWQSLLDFELQDEDVFEIDVHTASLRRSFRSVGTTLFNLAQQPHTDEVWVANTDARNLVRFEPQLKGHVVENRISRLAVASGSAAAVTTHTLSPPSGSGQNSGSIELKTAVAQPTDIVFNSAGDKAFVASFGTDRIVVLDGSGGVRAGMELSDASAAAIDPQRKRGPRSLVMHSNGSTLYALNRLSNSVSVLDTGAQRVVNEIQLSDPTPAFLRAGRGYLFDARLSGNHSVSCASCHIDGDRDGLAWDLGDPGGAMFHNGTAEEVHPMKGPLLTQTLRGLAGETLFHWRADRPGLESFNGTFEHLMGGTPLDDDDLALFVDYLQSIRFGPNPLVSADGSLPAEPAGLSARDGELIFRTQLSIGREGRNTFRCIDCHARPNGAGTNGFTGLIGQPMKAAQLRGLNERIPFAADGSRVSGFGFSADGSKESLREFLGDSHRFHGIHERDKTAIANFLRAFPTETASIVGFSRTLHAANRGDASLNAAVALLTEQAERGRCTVSATGIVRGERIDLVDDRGSGVFRDRLDATDERSLEQIVAELGDSDSFVTLVALPRASTQPGGRQRE